MSKILIRKAQGTMGMGTGTDLRIYNPRSESSTMFRHNHEDEDTVTGMEDGKHRDERTARKKKERKERASEIKNLKHIPLRTDDITEEEDEDLQPTKFDRELEPSLMTGTHGNYGAMTSMANQARGPGFAGGHAFAMSEPMEISFQLLKRDERQGFVGKKPKREKGAKARKDHKERSRKWRPSTGEFKRPPGGMTPSSATSRRAKARMRGIKGGKKTGLSRAHLAVEMSHRGVKTKQPMSKDPRKYRQYLGQQEARKRLGNIRTVAATPARYGARSYRSGRTGGGTLQSLLPGQAAAMRRPALRQIRPPPLMPPRMPSAPSVPGLTPPPTPSMGGTRGVGVQGPKLPTATVQGGPSMVMTGEVGSGSDLQKRGLSYYDTAELRQLVNEARRALKRKETKKKGKGTTDTSGAGSNLPKHPENGPKQTTRPEGATEDANNEPRTFGMDPIGHIVGRGGRTP